MALALLLFGTSTASADALNARPVVPAAILQSALDSITVSAEKVDAVNDQVDAAWFTLGASGGSIETLIFENPLAAWKDANSFGLYEAGNPGSKVEVFSGAASPTSGFAAQATVSILANGMVGKNGVFTGQIFEARTFGFYMTGPGGTVYSEDSLNPGGNAYALILDAGGRGVELNSPSFGVGELLANEYIVAFEDGGDRGFTDMIVVVESIVPVPEPGSIALCGLAVLGFAVYRRRRKA